MIAVKPWTERTFSLGVPLWRFPIELERLRGIPARVEELVKGLYRDELCARVHDHWSIQEHIGHLVDIEELGIRRLDELEAGVEILSAADMTNRKTHEAHHNERDIEDLLNELRYGRVLFVTRLEKLTGDIFRKMALHPRLKQPMTVTDLMFFIAEHDDHHIAKMRENINHLTGL